MKIRRPLIELFFILFFVFLSIYGYSQYVYYGYPTDKKALNKKSIVVLNIPSHHVSGGYRFIKMEQLDSLVEFLAINDTNKLRIEINCFYADFLDEDISKLLCRNLEEILEEKTTFKNYYIISNGNRNPVFCSEKKDVYYNTRNTRMEIFVE
ncbi:MAG: hypothetical protein GX292_06960 [Bacteroidales bacterium]|nr:hypothetical protein [Bacteroidales bacterium]